MKKNILMISVASFLVFFVACSFQSNPSKKETINPLTITQTFEEYVMEESGLIVNPTSITSIENISCYSNTIIKAKYLGYKDFSDVKREFLFEVEDAFVGKTSCSEIIHVYENKETSFISGKNYYLFLNGFLSSFYPHPVYSRYAPIFLIGESESGYTFYNGKTLGLDTLDDFDQFIRNEIVNKGLYRKDITDLEPESVESACNDSTMIILATIHSVEASSSSNPYICYARYSVDRYLKGEDLRKKNSGEEELSEDIANAAGLNEPSLPLMQAPAGTKPGDRFLLLFKIDPESGQLDMYSRQSSFFHVDSDEGRYILQCFE